MRFKTVITNISVVLSGICVLFTLVIGIMGIIIYNKYGFYPRLEYLFNALNGVEIDSMRSTSYSEPFYYMSESWVLIALAFPINFILAILMNIKDEIVRPIISIILTAGLIVLAVSSQLQKLLQDIFGNWVTIVYLAPIVGLVFCFINSEGGVLALISLGTWLFHLLVFPLVIWVINGGLVRIIPMLVVLVVVVIVIFFRSGSSNGFSSSSPSSLGSSSIDKDAQKLKNEIDVLKRNIKGTSHAIEEHSKGSIGYFHIDEKACQRSIEDDMKEIRSLEKQLKELESKKK